MRTRKHKNNRRETLIAEKNNLSKGKQKLKTYCFLDFEFNCENAYDRSNCEIISMSAIFKDTKGMLIEKFTRTISPTKYKYISPRCLELTGLSKNSILQSLKFEEVIDEFLSITNRFSNIEYYVWGDQDKRQVLKSAKFSGASKKIKSIAYSFIDLQKIIKEKLKSPVNYSLEKTAYIYNIKYNHRFIAEEDAICLSKIFFEFKNSAPNYEVVKKVNKFYRSQEVISNYRSKINNFRQINLNKEHYLRIIETTKKDTPIYFKLKRKLEKAIIKWNELEKQIEIEKDNYNKCLEFITLYTSNQQNEEVRRILE